MKNNDLFQESELLKFFKSIKTESEIKRMENKMKNSFKHDKLST